MTAPGGTRPKKRILINARLWQAGGMETHLLNLSRLLVGHDAEVTLVSRFASDRAPLVQVARQIPIRLLRTPFHRSQRFYRLSTLWAVALWPVLLDSGYDLLYSLELTGINRFLQRFLKPGARSLYSYIGAPRDPGDPFPESVLEPVDGILTEGRTQAAALRAAGVRCPIRVQPLLGHFSSPPRRSQSSPGEPLRLAYLGRFDRLKGVFHLLDFWPELEIGPCTLTYYGHGPEEEPLRREIRNRGFQEEVKVAGGWNSAHELAEILHDVDLVLHASETEGLSVALMEIMAHGVPFVASDVGATREFAEDNPDVAVVPLEQKAFIGAVRDLAQKLKSGALDGRRLQAYHRDRFAYDVLSQRWTEALLEPWGKDELPGRSR